MKINFDQNIFEVDDTTVKKMIRYTFILNDIRNGIRVIDFSNYIYEISELYNFFRYEELKDDNDGNYDENSRIINREEPIMISSLYDDSRIKRDLIIDNSRDLIYNKFLLKDKEIVLQDFINLMDNLEDIKGIHVYLNLRMFNEDEKTQDLILKQIKKFKNVLFFVNYKELKLASWWDYFNLKIIKNEYLQLDELIVIKDRKSTLGKIKLYHKTYENFKFNYIGPI
jgi:hypothetical protein